MTLFRRDLQERAVSTADSREFTQRFATKIKRLNPHKSATVTHPVSRIYALDEFSGSWRVYPCSNAD